MPRTVNEILANADMLAKRFENWEPGAMRDAAPVRALDEAVLARAAAERAVAEAVAAARGASVSWALIGTRLGTSGEAARQRYGKDDASQAFIESVDKAVETKHQPRAS